MGQQEGERGFDAKKVAGDDVVAKLREKYYLPLNASLADMEPVLNTLLHNPLTILDAAQLVLNRRVGAGEEALKLLLNPSFSANERLAALLMKATLEQEREMKGKQFLTPQKTS